MKNVFFISLFIIVAGCKTWHADKQEIQKVAIDLIDEVIEEV